MSENNLPPAVRQGQDWSAYHASQLNEKGHFLRLLRELCKEVVEPEYDTGHPPLPLGDMIFSLAFKVFSTYSSRRFYGHLREAQEKKLISSVPSANTLSEYMRAASVTPILQALLTKSCLPLAEVENVFAADSTGLGIPG